MYKNESQILVSETIGHPWTKTRKTWKWLIIWFETFHSSMSCLLALVCRYLKTVPFWTPPPLFCSLFLFAAQNSLAALQKERCCRPHANVKQNLIVLSRWHTWVFCLVQCLCCALSSELSLTLGLIRVFASTGCSFPSTATCETTHTEKSSK